MYQDRTSKEKIPGLELHEEVWRCSRTSQAGISKDEAGLAGKALTARSKCFGFFLLAKRLSIYKPSLSEESIKAYFYRCVSSW